MSSWEDSGEPCHWFAEGSMYVAVRLGEPNQDAQIGIGLTPREAVDSLESVPVQSGGREPVARALRWAHGADWISSPDLPGLVDSDVRAEW